MHAQVFKEDPLSDSIIDSNYAKELMDCSATVIKDEFTNFFPHFLAFCW